MPNIVGLSAVAIVGSEPTLTGAAALDLARAEARHRRVTVIDLIGDAAPLRAVAVTDDPHGVADCFEYGLSFGAVIRATTVHPNVRIMPSGSEPIPFAEALASARWDGLIEKARETGGLVVFAVLISTPALAALTSRVDCVVAAPSRLREVLEADQVAATTASRARLSESRSYVPNPPARPVPRVVAPATFAPSRRSLATALAAASVLLLIGLGWVITKRREAPAVAASTPIALSDSGQTQTDTVTSSAQLAPAGASGSSGGTATAPPGAVSSLDPGDSTSAALFALRIATYPTYVEALRALRQYPGRRRAATISPVVLSTTATDSAGGTGANAPAFALVAGAAHAAEDLHWTTARWPRPAGAPPSLVVRAPFGLRLAANLSADSARHLAAGWLARGIPAYTLVSSSGSATVYAGAFDTANAAVTLATSLRAIGLAPVIAYRTGSLP